MEIEIVSRDEKGKSAGYLATFCNACGRYRKDALVGPSRKSFLRIGPRYCRCEDNRTTQEVSVEVVAAALAAAE